MAFQDLVSYTLILPIYLSSSYSATYPSDVPEPYRSRLMANWNNWIQECGCVCKGPAFQTACQNKNKAIKFISICLNFRKSAETSMMKWWNGRHFDPPGLIASYWWSMSVKVTVRIEDEWMQLDIKRSLNTWAPFSTTMSQKYIQDNMTWCTWDVSYKTWQSLRASVNY